LRIQAFQIIVSANKVYQTIFADTSILNNRIRKQSLLGLSGFANFLFYH